MAKQTSNSAVKAKSSIIQDWDGGYSLELIFTAQPESNAQNWQIDFELPYTVQPYYVVGHGVDVKNHSDGTYTVKGENEQKKDLNAGQSIKSIFEILDYGQEAISPFDSSTVADSQPVVTATEPSDGGRVINVDRQFFGNISEAIAAAVDGDVVELGNKTYYTSGLYLNKDITLTGKPNTVIDGGGTSDTVITIDSGATGATIQNLEITNAKNGIYSNRAYNLTLQNLDLNNIGKLNVDRQGQNNIGIVANHANGLRLLDSTIENMGRSGVNVGDTDGAVISNITVKHVNLDAQHAQSHDAAGIKFFNTNDILLKDSYFSDINANHIWNDTTTGTTIENNTIEKVGEDFLRPSFNPYVDITGIYNEKSHNSIVRNNRSSAFGEFTAFRATEYTTQTMIMENNDFSRVEMGSTDYWVNEAVEILIAETENPSQADFSLFSNEYYQHMNIG